jgi:hypothetical protein
MSKKSETLDMSKLSKRLRKIIEAGETPPIETAPAPETIDGVTLPEDEAACRIIRGYLERRRA